MDFLVNVNRYLLASAAILLLYPHGAHAQPQPGSGEVRVVRFSDADTPRRGPDWGFSTVMRPGPGNNPYVYPIVDAVFSGSAAVASGLMVGDTIISVDGRDMRYHPFFPVQVAGTRYVILVRRGAEELELIYIFPEARETPSNEGPAVAPPN